MPCKTKAAQKASAAKHYQKNKVIMKARAFAFNKKVRIRNRDYVKGYKAERGCSRCPMRDPRCLDFHHLENKVANIADSRCLYWSLKRLQEEIDKCIILCANCHRIETAEGKGL